MTTQDPPPLPWLDPPYYFPEPEPEKPFILSVVRFELGQSMRPVEDPPYSVVRPTIRFVTGPDGNPWGYPHCDFTNKMLALRVIEIYRTLGAALDRLPPPVTVDGPLEDVLARLEDEERRLKAALAQARALNPQRADPLRLLLRRHGLRLDTIYDVDVLEGS